MNGKAMLHVYKTHSFDIVSSSENCNSSWQFRAGILGFSTLCCLAQKNVMVSRYKDRDRERCEQIYRHRRMPRSRWKWNKIFGTAHRCRRIMLQVIAGYGGWAWLWCLSASGFRLNRSISEEPESQAAQYIDGLFLMCVGLDDMFSNIETSIERKWWRSILLYPFLFYRYKYIILLKLPYLFWKYCQPRTDIIPYVKGMCHKKDYVRVL